MNLSIDDFDYELPPELVAQYPSATRSGSRLLGLSGATLADHRFADLPELLSPGDLLVFNDTRVIKARLFGEKESGGRVEVLVERVLSESEALVQVRASKPPQAGSALRLAGKLEVEVLGRAGEFYRLRFPGAVFDLLERHGGVPLPPYIVHAPRSEDESRYQTIYARAPGAVAAPTAGLHFDEALLAALTRRGVELAYVTLHVGAGTFQPVRVRNLAGHRMHSERYEIPRSTADAVTAARERGGKVVAVGTTTVRCLEASGAAAGSGETDLFITPGFGFRVVDRLVTNFHLPRSTLLVLVSAFAGTGAVRRAYRHAVDQRYRFYSYGDAMLVDRIPASTK
ncbi:MAG TPA: tRNA preQ1(34) S-adenosylmethionine ribosyltransferase-isomerase QueA [Burkholderiales bacterium]|jgi:S-adenosylmethionine:tRNA ribosyltransferase-isomerase|nr:tRNA preQ1(34) S-adenosylmethionine ribosyltransferase-isomerase QueA [Burkholderiales bacterium]